MPKEQTKKQPNGVSKEELEALAKQIQSEYTLAWKHQHPKIIKNGVRLKLYNNQKRDDKAVGDTTMFSIHQTVLAALYDDRLVPTFRGREEGDDETAENLTDTASYDYDEMQKDMLDYYWDWDASFFGRGFVVQSEYIRDPENGLFVPIPHVIDPLSLLRDPRASSVNGDMTGLGSARFLGHEKKMTKKDIEDHPHIFFTDFRTIKFGSGTKSLLKDAEDARTEAQGLQTTSKFEEEENLGANSEYDITVWYTHLEIKGEVKKVKTWSANDRAKIIGIEVLKHNYWPITDRPLYPTAHDWDGTSIPDLVEDKQRARAVLLNLGLNSAKADLYPMYAYDSQKITNRKDLNFGFNKFIPVDKSDGNVGNAIQPLNKASPNFQLINFVFATLDVAAQKATATPDIQQGIQSEKDRPLGETNLISSNVDTRHSLAAKVFGWSEKEFWRKWYQSYKDNFKENIDEKVIRLVGAFGPKWRPLNRENLVTPRYDPDIEIESTVVSRAKQMEDRAMMTEYMGLALQEPTSNRRYGLKKLAKLNGMEKDEIDRLFPPTIDERIAEDENDLLSDNKLVKINREDDHNVHLEIHSKAADTDATYSHIEAHKKALSVKKMKPEIFPEDQMGTDFQAPGTEKIIPQPSQMANKTVRPSQTSGRS